MKTIALTALLLLATPAFAADDPPVTCDQNAEDLGFTKDRVKDIQVKFKAETDPRHKMILGLEGEYMLKVYQYLLSWHQEHCSDI